MRIPEHLRPAEARERRRARAQARREVERQDSRVELAEAIAERRPMLVVFLLVLMIAVGGMLAGRSVMMVQPVKKHDPVGVASRQLTVLRIAVERFRFDCKRYPLTEEGLHALVSDRGYIGWRGRYVNHIRADPWLRPYVYRSDGQTLTLLSMGPDGVEGTDDDIVAPEPSVEDVAGPFGYWGDAPAATNMPDVAPDPYSVTIGRGGAPPDPDGTSVVLPNDRPDDAADLE